MLLLFREQKLKTVKKLSFYLLTEEEEHLDFNLKIIIAFSCLFCELNFVKSGQYF